MHNTMKLQIDLKCGEIFNYPRNFQIKNYQMIMDSFISNSKYWLSLYNLESNP